jgi:hypothetical protein
MAIVTKIQRQTLCSAARAVVLCLCIAGGIAPQVAHAQKEGGAGIMAAQDATEPNYVLSYFVMAIFGGAGMYVLAKPSRRKNMDEKEEGPT